MHILDMCIYKNEISVENALGQNNVYANDVDLTWLFQIHLLIYFITKYNLFYFLPCFHKYPIFKSSLFDDDDDEGIEPTASAIRP